MSEVTYQSPEITGISPCRIPLDLVIRWLIHQVLEGWGWQNAVIADAGAPDFDSYPLSMGWRPLSSQYPYELLIFTDAQADADWSAGGSTAINEDSLLHVIIEEHQVTFVHPRADELATTVMKMNLANQPFAYIMHSATAGGC